MIWTILGDFWPYVGGAVASLAVLVGAYFKGSANEKAKMAAKKAKANDDTHKRIDKVEPVDPSDHNDVVKRLRNLGQ